MTSATTVGGDFIIQTSASDPGTLCSLNGSVTQALILGGNFDAQDPNYFIPSGTALMGVTFNGAAAQSANFAGKTIQGITLSGAGKILNLTGALGMAGTMNVPSTYALNCGTNQITGAGTVAIASGATLELKDPAGITASGATGQIQTTTRTFDTSANYIYDGSLGQVTGDGLPATVNALTINNVAGVLLTADVAPAAALTLTAGELITGAHKVICSDSVSLTRTSGFVNGTLERGMGLVGTVNFPIGTAGAYAPVSFNVTIPGTPIWVDVSSSAGTDPNVPDAARAIARTWSLSPASPGFTADITFNYLDGDIGTATEANLKAARWTGAAWDVKLGSVATPANNTVTASGVSGFSIWTLFDPTPTAALTIPDGADWGNKHIGSGATTKRLTITNNGLDNLNITSCSVVAGGSADITVSTPPSSPIAPGASADAIISYTPTLQGPQSATIRVASDDPTGNKDQVFDGTGGYNLTIISAHDSPIPSGTTLVTNPAASFSASVDSPTSTTVGQQFVCLGWTGTGTAPASGTLNVTPSFTVTADSTITWNWKTQYWVETFVSPHQAGTVAPVTGWIDSGTVQSFHFTPANSNWQFDNWSGKLTSSTNPDSATIDASTSVTANASSLIPALFVSEPNGTDWGATHIGSSPAVKIIRMENAGTGTLSVTAITKLSGDADIVISTLPSLPASLSGSAHVDAVIQYTPTTQGAVTATFRVTSSVGNEDVIFNAAGGYDLTVTSAHGTPSPATELVTDKNLDITASIAGSPVAGATGTQYVSAGWTGTGNVPASGSGTSTASFKVTQDSSITWNWTTQYALTITTIPSTLASGDTVTPAAGSYWHDSGSSASLLATNTVGSPHFIGWSGDFTSTNLSDSVIMNAKKDITATFGTPNTSVEDWTLLK
jgi:hypothetical protein